MCMYVCIHVWVGMNVTQGSNPGHQTTCPQVPFPEETPHQPFYTWGHWASSPWVPERLNTAVCPKPKPSVQNPTPAPLTSGSEQALGLGSGCWLRVDHQSVEGSGGFRVGQAWVQRPALSFSLALASPSLPAELSPVFDKQDLPQFIVAPFFGNQDSSPVPRWSGFSSPSLWPPATV